MLRCEENKPNDYDCRYGFGDYRCKGCTYNSQSCAGNKEILTKNELSNIIENYVQVVEDKDEDTGKKSYKQIFPRYHQLHLVTSLLADTKRDGVGGRYLIQHSAGSGKSNSIAWLAHQLVNLKADNGKLIFEEQKDEMIYNYGIIRCKRADFPQIDPDDYLISRETTLSMECLVRDREAVRKKYSNFIVDNASIEDIMLFYIKGASK